jgi:hypothetical protein
MIRAQVVGQLEAYLAGDLTLSELETWLVASSPAIRESADIEAVYLADEVTRRLKDTTDGLMDEAGFRAVLHQLLFPHQFTPIWRDSSDTE